MPCTLHWQLTAKFAHVTIKLIHLKKKATFFHVIVDKSCQKILLHKQVAQINLMNYAELLIMLFLIPHLQQKCRVH